MSLTLVDARTTERVLDACRRRRKARRNRVPTRAQRYLQSGQQPPLAATVAAVATVTPKKVRTTAITESIFDFIRNHLVIR